jgi:DNA (cytosine-5)-methyltransferase 1
MINHASLFSGIGGFDLAADWIGWNNVFNCELDEFGRNVLKYYWPNATSYEDITQTDFSFWRGQIDILTGGFPCQPFSVAGKRKGKEDERHLWPEMLRAIREISPSYIVAENVHGIVNWNGGLVFNEVQSDLEAQGYEVQPVILPACAVGAPHRRDRVWFVAHSDKFYGNISGFRTSEISTFETSRVFKNLASDTDGQRFGGKSNRERKTGQFGQDFEKHDWQNFPTQSPVCGRNDGISTGLDRIAFSKWRRESIKAYGNAIVPQVAYEIFKTIQMTENNYKLV